MQLTHLGLLLAQALPHRQAQPLAVAADLRTAEAVLQIRGNALQQVRLADVLGVRLAQLPLLRSSAGTYRASEGWECGT